MAILAITLAPRLTKYVEKARRASDEEVINAIYTAVRLGVLDDDTLADGITVVGSGLELNDTSDGIYEVTNKEWKFNASYTGGNLMLDEIKAVVGEFKLKSSDASATTVITLTLTNADDVTVELAYDGAVVDYTASDSAVRP